ncbi:hypothetical protein IFHNHDMJ_02432 [Synechococcus sp. CBW1107]|nr:hypothetical protein IFHNHDMJ_02432 [Synechococcus sp. CBW1107]
MSLCRTIHYARPGVISIVERYVSILHGMKEAAVHASQFQEVRSQRRAS